MPDLTATESSVLAGLSGIANTVDKLLSSGVTAAELAETVLKLVNPSAAASLQSLIDVLEKADALVKKAE